MLNTEQRTDMSEYATTELLTEWKSKPNHKGQPFIEDGVIDIDGWQGAKVKILYLLKEAYSRENESYDLRGLYSNWASTEIPKGGNTGPNLVRWTSGIERVLSGQSNSHYPEPDESKRVPNGDQERRANLHRIAMVNIKKNKGTTISSDSDLARYVREDGDLIRRQIDLLTPDIVICGGTFNLMQPVIKESVQWVSDRVYKQGDTDRYWVDFNHPAVRENYLIMYHALCSIIASSPIKERYGWATDDEVK